MTRPLLLPKSEMTAIGPSSLIAAQRRAGNLDPDMDGIDQAGGLVEREAGLARPAARAPTLSRNSASPAAKPSPKTGISGRRAVAVPAPRREDRSRQPVGSERARKRRLDPADLPADHRPRPARDRRVLDRISVVERGREFARIIVEPVRRAARARGIGSAIPSALLDEAHEPLPASSEEVMETGVIDNRLSVHARSIQVAGAKRRRRGARRSIASRIDGGPERHQPASRRRRRPTAERASSGAFSSVIPPVGQKRTSPKTALSAFSAGERRRRHRPGRI